MSSSQEFSIDVVSADSFSPEDEADLRGVLEVCTGTVIMRALTEAWVKEHGSGKMVIDTPDNKTITSTLKFRELEFFKERIGEVLALDDDRKIIIRLDDDSLTSNRNQELYALLVYLGMHVRGWESDSEFSWQSEGAGKLTYFWEGDGNLFPDGDFAG